MKNAFKLSTSWKEASNRTIYSGSQLGQEFELICDASDYAIGSILGQNRIGRFHVIYYANKVLNEAQINYVTTEKEILAVVYALEKFWLYLVGSKIIVYTNN